MKIQMNQSLLATLALVAIVAGIAIAGASLPAQAEGAHKAVVINEARPGEQVDIAPYKAHGKITIFDFYSKFCPPCVRIAPLLENLMQQRKDIVVFKVDINRPSAQGIDWQSPVAQQYQLRSIPHFKIFDASGKLMAEGQAASKMVMEWIQKGAQK